MNEIYLYQSPEEMERDREKLRKNKKSYVGYVYAVEFGDHVKIGSTDNPISRIHSLCSLARNYCFTGIGRIALSPSHSNFRSNEMLLHATFSEKRIEDGELFDIKLESAIDAISNIELIHYTRKVNEEEIMRLLKIVQDTSIHPMFRRFNLFMLFESIQEMINDFKEKSEEFSRLKSYAPRGTETFFNLIADYSDKTRHAIYEKMKSFPIEKQKRILGKIFREKMLPDFLKTIAEGE